MQPPSDFELLTNWRGGQADAGQALFSRHFERLFRFFQRKCCGEADDLVQATFLACLKAKDQFEGRSSFRTYLYTIARHELYRHWRTQVRQGEQVDFQLSSLADLSSTMATKIQRNQAARKVRDVMATLPLEQQTLLEMHYWHEQDAKALAQIFEVTPETVRTRLYRARRALKRALESQALPAHDLPSFVRAQVEQGCVPPKLE